MPVLIDFAVPAGLQLQKELQNVPLFVSYEEVFEKHQSMTIGNKVDLLYSLYHGRNTSFCLRGS